ncbi:MAG TPA: DUF4190 domain-containing protein [Cellulomonas sp.]
MSSTPPGPVPPYGAAQDGPPPAPGAAPAPTYPAAGVPAGPAYPAPGAPGATYPYPGAPGGASGMPGGVPGAPGPKKGFAVTALVLGIVAVVLCLLPIINNLSFVLAVVAVVFAILTLVGLRKGTQTGKGMAITSIVFAVVALVGAGVSQSFYSDVLDEVADSIDEAQVAADQPVDDTVTEDAAADDAAAADAAAADAAAADGTNLAFDEPFLYEDGLQVTIGAPQPYTPSEYAYGTDGGSSYVSMVVTIVNGSTENFDPTLFYTSASSAGAEATELFDGEALAGSPQTPVLPGGTVSFTIGYALNDPAAIVLEVEPSMFTYDSFVVTNG